MGQVTRQDMQSMLEQLRIRLQDQLATRQDVQRSMDNSRDRIISYTHDYLQNNQQQYVRHFDDRAKQFRSQIAALETRVQSLEQELQTTHELLHQMAQKQRSVVIPNVQEAVNNQHNYRYVQEG